MIRFRQFINESNDVVSHLEHIEDNVLNGGVAGARNSVEVLRSVRDALAGRSKSKINATVKYDGAPSIFAGIDPSDGKFFVAKKGIFNKNPKVYKTRAEVHADTSGDLANKLAMALEYLPKIGIKGIVQGDFMFDHASLSTVMIDGQKYLTFHPNTIVYAVPYDSAAAKAMRAAKIGIVWHTRYSGKDFASLKAEGGTAIAKTLKHSKDVWFDDVLIKDLTGTATMTAEETSKVTSILSEIGTQFQRLSASTLNDLTNNAELLTLTKIFVNSRVRANNNSEIKASELVDWIHKRFQTELDSKKTDKGKATVELRKKAVMQYFAHHSSEEVNRIFYIMSLIVSAKNVLISKLNRIGHMHTFIKTAAGYQVTGQEGYVICDAFGKNAVKLVDRFEFSKANFSPDAQKGWQR